MVQGVARFRAKMRAIPQNVRIEVEMQLAKEGDKVVTLMKVLAPVKTGALRDSIQWRPSGEAAPEGALSVGVSDEADLSITITAGDEGSQRTQRRASGTRARDQGRSGDFTSSVARFQEFGTRNMAANPFFYPAWRAERNRVRANIRAAVKRAFRKAK